MTLSSWQNWYFASLLPCQARQIPLSHGHPMVILSIGLHKWLPRSLHSGLPMKFIPGAGNPATPRFPGSMVPRWPKCEEAARRVLEIRPHTRFPFSRLQIMTTTGERTTGERSRTRMKKTYENVHYKWCVSTVFISTSTLLTSDRAGLMHVSCMSIRSKTSSASSLHVWGHQLARIVATVTWARAKPSRNIWDSATFTGTPGRSWAFRLDLGLILIVHIVHIVLA